MVNGIWLTCSCGLNKQSSPNSWVESRVQSETSEEGRINRNVVNKNEINCSSSLNVYNSVDCSILLFYWSFENIFFYLTSSSSLRYLVSPNSLDSLSLSLADRPYWFSLLASLLYGIHCSQWANKRFCRSTNAGVCLCRRSRENVLLMFTFLSVPANLFRFTWMVCEMEDKWQFTCYFVGNVAQDLFKTVCSILA